MDSPVRSVLHQLKRDKAQPYMNQKNTLRDTYNMPVSLRNQTVAEYNWYTKIIFEQKRLRDDLWSYAYKQLYAATASVLYIHMHCY